MRSRREPVVVGAGLGVLAGIAAGCLVGALRVLFERDLDHGTLFLAASRITGPAVLAALMGGAMGTIVALAAKNVPDGKRAKVVAATIASLLWIAGILFFILGPLRATAIPQELAASRPKLGFGAMAALIAAWSFAWIAATGFPTGARTARKWLAIGGWCAAAVLAVGLIGLLFATRARASGRPSILIVSLDTMRADQLGALGGTTTPHLDRLAAEGTLFTQATSASPWTLPSHASIFTSRLPFDHGARFTRNTIRPPLVTLAEVLKNAGYATAGFTGDAYVDASFGFDQGFDVYQAFHEDVPTGPQPIADAAGAWIRSHRGRPFFAFVHTYECHAPYSEPTYADASDRGRLPAVIDFPVVEKIHRGDLDLTDQEKRYTRALYRGDVARADRVIGGLLESLKASGDLDDVILVVLSDHGEDLWDHDQRRSPGHGHSLYQELLRVPLIVRAPGRVPAGAKITTPVSLIDIAPTLLEMTHVPVPDGFQGRSIAASLQQGREPDPQPVWSESVEYGPDRVAVREGRYKAIVIPRPDVVHSDYHPAVQPVEVFDLDADPLERVDLAGQAGPEARRLVQLAADRARIKLRDAPHPGRTEELPEELRKSLKTLGYVN